MTCSIAWTEGDVLQVLQSLAQAQSGKSGRQVSDTSLFVEICRTDAFSAEQIATLACEALHFFSLNTPESAFAALQAELVRQPELAQWAKTLFAHWDTGTVCFHSSGSTGTPTRHVTPVDLLVEEVRAGMPRFHTRQRVLSVMPVHHIYGMVYGPILAMYLKIPLLFAPPLPLSSFFAMLRPGDLVVAFPLFWKALLAMCVNAATLPFPTDVTGFTATSPCPPEVLQALITPHPNTSRALLAGITEIYGSTETSAIGMRCDGEEWYTLFPCWTSEVDARGVRRIRRGAASAFAGEPVPLPDITVWRDDRHFKPERRSDNAVQVGGINVYPQKIAAIIRTHPLVRDCAVRLMRPDEGVRLKAFIVPALGVERQEAVRVFGKAFREWLAARLDTASRPKRITLGDALPANAIGKSCDWE